MNPPLPHSPQQDLILLFGSAFSDRIILFERKAWNKRRIKMAKRLIMFALKVGDAFQSTISALQRSDGISPPTGQSSTTPK
jgi:hypothetical protein